MKNLSVTTFLHLLFITAIVVLTFTFLFFLSWDKERQESEEKYRYKLIPLVLFSQNNHNKEQISSKIYSNLDVSPVKTSDIEFMNRLLKVHKKTLILDNNDTSIDIFELDNSKYIHIKHLTQSLILKDIKEKNYNFEYILGIGSSLILFLFLIYFAAIKKLYPLKRLHNQIEKFAQGDMNTRITYNCDDEVGKIAKSFDDAIMHIHALSTSKNLFMRNMMHELKTPITKGRIIVEMIEDEVTKKVLVRVFGRMNELISELAELERVTTKNFEPQFEYVLLSNLIDESKELLITQNTSIQTDIEDQRMYTDKKLMILVLKNLLDNGIKYGKERSVKIKTKGNSISIISEGSALKYPLSYYTEPFSQAEKRSFGFGLGLYIVHSILEKLEYTFQYEHKEGKNIFMILPSSNH